MDSSRVFTCLQVEGSLEQEMSLALGCHSKFPFPVSVWKPYQHLLPCSPPALCSLSLHRVVIGANSPFSLKKSQNIPPQQSWLNTVLAIHPGYLVVTQNSIVFP